MITSHFNNRRDLDKALHPLSTVYNDNKTPTFSLQKREDFANRATFELERYNDPKVVFLLFTYNPQHLPHFPNTSIPSFFRPHISTLVKALKDKYPVNSFSYLIGAEYGVDEKHNKLPHYHACFILDCSIKPRDFVEFCRTIWTGHKYGQRDKSWRYGNLGYMFPSPWDCDYCDSLHPSERATAKHDYLAHDNGACISYCSKYAVKSYGFYRDKDVKALTDTPLKRRELKHFLPYVFVNQHFGFNMLEYPSVDLVKGVVYNRTRKDWVNIPYCVLRRALYIRKFVGYKQATGIEGEPLYRSNGQPQLVRDYQDVLSLFGMQIKFKRLLLSLDYQALKVSAFFHWSYNDAYKIVTAYKVYRFLRFTSLSILERDDINADILCSHDVLLRIYTQSYLLRGTRSNCPFDDIADISAPSVVDSFFDMHKYTQYLQYVSYRSFINELQQHEKAVDKYNQQLAKARQRGYDTVSIDDINKPRVHPSILSKALYFHFNKPTFKEYCEYLSCPK